MRLALSAASAVAIAACRGPAPTAPLVDAELTAAVRFPHGLHDQVACVDCHEVDRVVAGALAIPGRRDHDPCDREQCHRAEFTAPPGLMCALCHIDVDPTGREPAIAAPYPPLRGARALPSRFSHALHLDFGRMEQAVGFHVSCTDCHTRGAGDSDPPLPGHAACARCHAPEAAPEGAPVMTLCDACHTPGVRSIARTRWLIVGDLRFDHVTHDSDRTGKAIACIECHDQVTQVDRAGVHPAPKTATCVACHDDDERTPRQQRMRVCETCHLERAESFGSLAPRSHLPPTERPDDHTLAFRADHATEARADSARCARCHEGMSGSSRDTCDECHQSMRPRDHTVGWREFDHGPAASTERDRCATCHVGEFCTACHSRPPRTHFPRLDFRLGSHGELARLEPRACMTCHLVERDCVGAGCHVVGPRR